MSPFSKYSLSIRSKRVYEESKEPHTDSKPVLFCKDYRTLTIYTKVHITYQFRKKFIQL